MADFESYSPQYTLRKRALAEGRGSGWSKWKLRIENCVFRNCELATVQCHPILEKDFVLSEFEFKVFTLEIDFQFKI